MDAGSIIAITGGTGSFGAVAARRFLDAGVGEVRIIARRQVRPIEDPRVRYFVGDVGDEGSLARAVRGADHVIHAAAMKLVPDCEERPEAAVATNVLGTGNVIRACAAQGVKSVVCTSTDKAVRPAGVMGMSKALMERVVAAHAREGTVVCVVRFGNLMFSEGTVLPLFARQLRSGEPLTVTDPAMTRFLMPLSQSVDLVEHALARARSGDLFVRKSPAATVGDLARAMALLAGKTPQIRIIGARPGEKRHEVMLTGQERGRAVDEGDYFRVPLGGGASPAEEFSSANAARLDAEAVAALIASLPQWRAEP